MKFVRLRRQGNQGRIQREQEKRRAWGLAARAVHAVFIAPKDVSSLNMLESANSEPRNCSFLYCQDGEYTMSCTRPEGDVQAPDCHQHAIPSRPATVRVLLSIDHLGSHHYGTIIWIVLTHRFPTLSQSASTQRR